MTQQAKDERKAQMALIFADIRQRARSEAGKRKREDRRLEYDNERRYYAQVMDDERGEREVAAE